MRRPAVIVDFGLGNLFSVQQACQAVGLSTVISGDREVLLEASAVILPGVGAFGDAMATLRRLDLTGPLQDAAARGTPCIGICLGMQLFMTRSEEFGDHAGLGLIEGHVARLRPAEPERKVPQVGWNAIRRRAGALGEAWAGTPLRKIPEGSLLYFVHSYFATPADETVVLSETCYGGFRFCSSLQKANIFACQFHPERSAETGLDIYRNIAAWVQGRVSPQEGTDEATAPGLLRSSGTGDVLQAVRHFEPAAELDG